MSEEKIEKQSDEIKESENTEDLSQGKSSPVKKGRKFFTRRNGLIALGLTSILLILLVSLVGVFYKIGVFDTYVKEQFRAALADMGIVFDATEFHLTINPLQLTIEKATFNNKKTGDKIFYIKKAVIGMTVTDLYQLQFERNIDVTSTDLNGVEAWVMFDENGNSNFEDVNLTTPQRRIKFNYASSNFSLKDGLIHFGEATRKISGDAKNVQFQLTPIAQNSPEEILRYQFTFNSTESNFIYNESKLEPVNIFAKGIANQERAEITELKLTTPIGESLLSGIVENYESPKYDLKIKSTIDLNETSSVFPLGTKIVGIGNFEGTVKGEGENYQVIGEVTSENLAASNIRLQGLKVDATVDGEGLMYNANGKAIAELLTFEDFRIELPQIYGNIRGTGTDFKWYGELEAAAAKSPLGTIGGLYINDAFAEYKDRKFYATFGTLRSRKFSNEDVNLESVQSRNIRIVSSNGLTTAEIPNVTAGKLDVEGATLRDVNISNATVKNQNGETNVQAGNVRAGNVETEDARLKNVTANGVDVRNRQGTTDVTANGVIAENVETENARLKNVAVKDLTVRNQNKTTNLTARNVQADNLDANGAKLGKIDANGVDVSIIGDETKVFSENVKIAKVETDAAILGNLNVAGVRFSVRQGRIEGTSADFKAGDVDLRKNGKLENVAVSKPVFVLEPSGRYRASLDMSLGGGVLGNVKLGKAKAQVVAVNDQIELNNLTAEVMDGQVDGKATIALNNNRRSDIKADFTNLDLSKLLALQGGRVIPIEGKTNGKVDLNFAGTNFRRASGNIVAEVEAKTGTEERGFVPLTGRLAATANNGLFDLDYANFNTEKSSLNATGRFDLSGNNSDLTVALNSVDAKEIERIVRVLNLSPELEQQLNKYQAEFAGNLVFNGNLKGNISNPLVEGRASLDSLILRGRDVGSLVTNLSVKPTEFTLTDGVLQERDGGNLTFDVTVPNAGINNIAVNAKLNNVNVGNVLAVLPIKSLPDFLKNLQANASGDLNLSGLPNEMQGEANITANEGSLNGQTFDNLVAKATFQGSLINIEKFDAQFGNGSLSVKKGFYRTDTTEFDFNIEGTQIPAQRVLAFFPNNTSIPDIEGNLNLIANAKGFTNDTKTFDVGFEGIGQNIVVNDYSLGNVNFDGKTVNQVLQANLVTRFQGQPQTTTATLEFNNPNLPLKAETTFNRTRLAPYIAIFRKPETDSVTIDGTATGKVFLTGNLMKTDDNGERVFTTENLGGTGEFTQLDLMVDETPLVATSPINVRFNSNVVVLTQPATFTGGGSNLIVSGSKALSDNTLNALRVEGRINLRLLNSISDNVFFSGLADVEVRLTGTNANARLNGTGQLQNGSASTFVGSERITFERLKGNILFTSNQIQVEQITGFLGGGRVTASGGVLLRNDLKLDRFRFAVQGVNITAPLPKDFLTTGNADIEINGRRTSEEDFTTFISGTINARRSVYRKDIDLADLIAGRGDRSLSTGSGDIGTTNLDIRIVGRNALVVRNNLADLTATADLRVTGDVDFPQISGRITADSGTLFFRSNRYIIQRGVVTFPPNTSIEPVVNLQLETEIKGYQIFLNLNGSLTDSETLGFIARSNPSLPQDDVTSLITTGNLFDSPSGIGGQGGVNTAAEVLTDEIINKPIARATDKLFGLNRFELDPIVSGQRGNPTARLTVGRQINRNLLVTYSTNLSEDQNQVLALEYRVSNRLSFVAQYEQRSLSNVTQQRNSFSFEVRLRKRF